MIIFCLFGIILYATPVYLQDADSTSKMLEDFNEYLKTGNKLSNVNDSVQILWKHPNVRDRQFQYCRICNFVVDGVMQYRKSGASKQLTSKILKDLCLVFTDWGTEACDGQIDTAIDAILYMIDNKNDLTAERVCAIYMQRHQCHDPNIKEWSVKIPAKTDNAIKPTKSEIDESHLKILHLTDIHYDPNYVPGTDAACGKPLCCQKGKPARPEDAAGYWGDYRACDIPWHSVLNLMDQTKSQHSQIDFVYFTGDVIPHDPWAYTRKSNLNLIKQLSDLFLKTYTSVPVYPIIGNHEAYPCDFFSPMNVSSDVSTQWLYSELAEDWARWLPEDTKETIKKGGYYSVLARKGFRIIVLNSISCYTDNLWLVYDDVDPYGQLQWLTDTLLESEKNGESVHILSHVPPGSIECWKPWSDQFNNIVKRFPNTIKAQFNGHTHIDEIRVFLDDDKKNAINVAYNGGSFTHYIGKNPNYKVFDMNSQTYEILDYETWIFNLTEANQDKNIPPNWFRLYSFKDAYGLNGTNMEDFFDWIQRMKNDPGRELLEEYFKFQSRASPVALERGCDNKCMDQLLCEITALKTEEIIECFK